MSKETILCSACLLGVPCRYNAQDKTSEKALKLRETHDVILVCPEQLGGLPTPRPPAEIVGAAGGGDLRVVDKNGMDVTAEFVRGAEEVLRIARLAGATEAVLKSRSPSCGSTQVYDGTFTGALVPGDGVTAALLKKHGIRVISEEDL
jgi:uncharacterized protein YbbK (DUF523 family)